MCAAFPPSEGWGHVVNRSVREGSRHAGAECAGWDGIGTGASHDRPVGDDADAVIDARSAAMSDRHLERVRIRIGVTRGGLEMTVAQPSIEVDHRELIRR